MTATKRVRRGLAQWRESQRDRGFGQQRLGVAVLGTLSPEVWGENSLRPKGRVMGREPSESFQLRSKGKRARSRTETEDM